MPAKDRFHNAVCSALIKEGWTITHDPLTLKFEDVTLFADLGAEKVIGAQKGKEKIAIEIKSFLSESMVSEFHAASGQYINYRFALADIEPERILYLAVKNDVYKTFISRRFVQRLIKFNEIKLVVFNPDIEEIVLWL